MKLLMIWIIAYLVVGMAFGLYMPIKQARGRARLDAITPSHLASMSDDDRKLLDLSASVIRADYSIFNLVVGGLLWPIQVLIIVAVEILFAMRRGH